MDVYAFLFEGFETFLVDVVDILRRELAVERKIAELTYCEVDFLGSLADGHWADVELSPLRETVLELLNHPVVDPWWSDVTLTTPRGILLRLLNNQEDWSLYRLLEA